ncbi:MAG: hypothetical protein ACOZFS_00240 [Thermodesulfobacteriota bacterium]
MFKDLKELVKLFELDPDVRSAVLQLDHYLVLEARTEAAESFLSQLIWGLYLPFTVSWLSEAGFTVRLYKNPYEKSFTNPLAADRFGIRTLYGPRDRIAVPRSYDGEDEESLLEEPVAALPEKTLTLLGLMDDLCDKLIFHESVPPDVAPQDATYRNII